MAIKDLEESGQDVAFSTMDNLTRARLRRKLKERWNTIDAPVIADTNKAESNVGSGENTKPAAPKASSSQYMRRRYSDNRTHWPLLCRDAIGRHCPSHPENVSLMCY